MSQENQVLIQGVILGSKRGFGVAVNMLSPEQLPHLESRAKPLDQWFINLTPRFRKHVKDNP